jgi:hypothetical protein
MSISNPGPDSYQYKQLARESLRHGRGKAVGLHAESIVQELNALNAIHLSTQQPGELADIPLILRGLYRMPGQR